MDLPCILSLSYTLMAFEDELGLLILVTELGMKSNRGLRLVGNWIGRLGEV